MPAIVYLDRPGKPRVYLRRIPGPKLYLWHPDPALALALDNQKAAYLAAWFQVSSSWPRDNAIWKNYQPTGEYGTCPTLP